MENFRQEKVGKQVQKDLAEIIQQQAGAWLSGVMVTVTAVRMSPDLSLAKAYLSLLGKGNNADNLKVINAHKQEIRNSLGKRMRYQVKKIPDINFYIDDSYEYAKKIDELLK